MPFKLTQWVDILKSFGEIQACESGSCFTRVPAKRRKEYVEDAEMVTEGDLTVFEFTSLFHLWSLVFSIREKCDGAFILISKHQVKGQV